MISTVLLCCAFSYVLFGIYKEGQNKPYWHGIGRLILFLGSVFVLGFFEAGQVGLCRLRYSQPKQDPLLVLEVRDEDIDYNQQNFESIRKLLLEEHAIEKYLVRE